MARVQRYEDLVAWQKARAFTKNIYSATRHEPFSRDFGLAGQIQRASVSTMSNIAEGVERYGTNELAHFLSLAKGSNGEARSQLYVALDVGYLTQEQFDELYNQANEVGRLISGLRASIVSDKR